MHKRMKEAQECLMKSVEHQLLNIEQVDTEELGEVIDMIKDLEEAIYYETITKAMEKGAEEERHQYSMMYGGRNGRENPEYTGGNDRRGQYGNMYPMMYDGGMYGGQNGTQMYGGQGGNQHSGSSGNNNSSSNGQGGSRQYGDKEYTYMRDDREGKSPMSRRMYMESKEKHHDKATQMRELENYMQELTQDVVEMVEGASQEEKQYLSKRVAALANKLAQLND